MEDFFLSFIPYFFSISFITFNSALFFMTSFSLLILLLLLSSFSSWYVCSIPYFLFPLTKFSFFFSFLIHNLCPENKTFSEIALVQYKQWIVKTYKELDKNGLVFTGWNARSRYPSYNVLWHKDVKLNS